MLQRLAMRGRIRETLGPWLWIVALGALLIAGLWAGRAAVVFGHADGKPPAEGQTVVVPDVSASPAGKPGRELTALRTRTSRTYLVEGDSGARMARVSASSVNFRDAAGQWRSIDNTLMAVDGGFRNKANRYIATLPGTLAGAVKVSEDGDDVAFSLRDAQGTAKVQGPTAVYGEAFAGVDVTYTAKPDSLKELILLKSADARRSFVFDLELGAGLRPQLAESGALLIRDGSDDVRMSVPAPFMYDAQGKRSRAVTYALDRVQTGWRLTMTAADAWLDAPGRAWPVAIDPQVMPYAQTDCALDEALSSQSFCGDSVLYIGRGAGHDHRSILRFDVPGAVPDDAKVTYAALGLWFRAQSGTQAKRINVHRLTRSFATGATWNTWDGTNPWGAAGGDFDPAVACEWCALVGGSASGGGDQPGGWSYWNTRVLVADWATGAKPNYGLLLKDDPDSASIDNFLTFDSREVVGHEPKLDIRYEPRVGVIRGHKYESQTLTDRLSLAVNSSNGNLLLRSSELTIPGGIGPDLQIGRSYNSQQEAQLAYGKGWGMDTGPDVRIEELYSGDLVYHGPSGVRAFFARVDNTNTLYTSPSGFDAKVVKDAATNQWTYTENASQRKLTFDGSGRLVRDQDRNNRAITFTYNASTREIQKITDSHNRATTFTYTSGRITQMTDPAGRCHVYAYDTSGRLTSYTDPENGVTRIDWGTYGPVLLTTPAGRQTKLTYHGAGADEGRVASVIRVTNTNDPFASLTGPTTQFAYTVNQDGSGQSVVTDPNTKQVTTVFDSDARPTKTTDGASRVTKNTYTTNSNVETFTIAGNTGTTPNSKLLYDSENNLTGTNTPVSSTTDPSSCTSTTCVQSAARYGESTGVASTVPGKEYLLTSTTNAQGRSKTLSYDANGNPKTIASSLGTITLNYDAASPGKLDSITDQRAKTTSYAYDSAGNLTQITPPMPLGATTLTYTTSLSRIATVTDANNQLRTLAYDNLDRVTKITYSNGSYVQFVYDKDGNLTARNDSVGGNTTYSYDQLSRLLSETLPGATSNNYTYDPVGNLKTLTDSGGTVTYDYDGANRNTSVLHATENITLGYTDQQSNNGPTVTTNYPNGVSITRSADYAGRLAEIKAIKGTTTLEHLTYAYDDATYGQGVLRVRAVDVLAGKTTRYQYDDLDRLSRARTYTTGTTAPADTSDCATDARLACYEYSLDAAGNRTQRTVTGSSVTNSTTTYAYNDANQLTTRTAASSVSSYNYDANGNHTTRTGGAPRTLGYNLRDQTTNLAGTTMGYLGAGQDQLVSEGSTALQHNILGLARRTSSYYTRGSDGTPLAQRTATNREYYTADALGSTIRTTDTAGNTQATYAYDPDGNTTTTTGTTTNPLRYAAGYQTIPGLYHYGQRYYDPADARWTQPDPLDQATDLRQANRYGYVGGDPINLIDPFGTHNLTTSGGCAGVGASVTRDTRGRQAYKTRFGGLSVGVRSCSFSAIGYTGTADDSVSGSVTVCGGLCVSYDNDKGVGFGLGFGISASISFS